MLDAEAVYRRYFQTVYRYLLSLCRDAALAEEITQGTCFQTLKKIDTLREGSAVESWLISIARNLYFDHCRRQKRHTANEKPPAEQTADTADSTPEAIYFRYVSISLFCIRLSTTEERTI